MQEGLWYKLVNISEKIIQVNQNIKFYNYSMTSEQCSTP